MLVNKITTGFVVQTYDTDAQKWIKQEFIAGDEVNYEFENGESLSEEEIGKEIINEYLPLLMKQPRYEIKDEKGKIKQILG